MLPHAFLWEAQARRPRRDPTHWANIAKPQDQYNLCSTERKYIYNMRLDKKTAVLRKPTDLLHTNVDQALQNMTLFVSGKTIKLYCKTHSPVAYTFFPSFCCHLLKRQCVRIAWTSLEIENNKWSVDFEKLKTNHFNSTNCSYGKFLHTFVCMYITMLNDVQQKWRNFTTTEYLTHQTV